MGRIPFVLIPVAAVDRAGEPWLTVPAMFVTVAVALVVIRHWQIRGAR